MATGGKRRGAGRPKGRKDDKTLRMEAAARRIFEKHKPKDGELTSLEFFRAIYRSSEFTLATRMDAAAKALPYEHPQLKAVELTGPGGGPLTVEIVRFSDKTSK